MRYFVVALLLMVVGRVSGEDIEALDHHLYKNVKITRVEPDGITISHDAGISKIYYSELPDALRSRFHFDPAAARAFREATERQQTQIYLQAHPEVAPTRPAPAPVTAPPADYTVTPDVPPAEHKTASSDAHDALESIATPKPITLRSEIERGMAALGNAARTPDSSQFREYVESIVNGNKQKNTDTDGFCYGLYYQAWHMAWFFASNGFPDRFQQAFCESNANIFYLQSKVLRNKLKLSDADAQKAAHGSYIPNENAIYEQVMNSKRYQGSMPKRQP